MRFSERVAIVTGSGRGIGRATALALAAEGAAVTVVDLNGEAAASVVAEITGQGGQATAAVGSVADPAFAPEVVATTRERHGPVDVLVNNAGIIAPAPAAEMTPEDWQRVIDINLSGVFHFTRAVGPAFQERHHAAPDAHCAGKIVNVASIAGVRGTDGQVNYGAAKSGVIGITMSIAREWARFRVTSNAVAFGPVATPMIEGSLQDDAVREQILAQIPLRRVLTPEECAQSILFLASADADYITGHTLNVSGGLHIGF